MEKISGVIIKAFLNGRSLIIDKNGCIGKLIPPNLIEIKVCISPEYKQRIYAITVDGKKTITEKKNCARVNSLEALYEFNVRIQRKNEPNGHPHTHYQENNMRLVKIESGNVEIWQICLVAHKGKFFLVTEKTYTNCCFRDEKNQIICPTFKHRPKLTRYLRTILSNHAEALPRIKEFQKVKENKITADGLPIGKGVVDWYNTAQGFGLIKTPEGKARLHRSEIITEDENCFPIPKPGQFVTYDGLREPFLKDRNTSFKKEAFGVTPL